MNTVSDNEGLFQILYSHTLAEGQQLDFNELQPKEKVSVFDAIVTSVILIVVPNLAECLNFVCYLKVSSANSDWQKKSRVQQNVAEVI